VPLPITVAPSPPVVVRVISPGPGLMTLLLTFLVGAATALVVQLVVQLYVVPMVETRKRREDRWERDVLELGELLTSLVEMRAQEARGEQLAFRDAWEEESKRDFDRDRIAQQAVRAEQASRAYLDLVWTRADWLADRVIAFNPAAEEIAKFQSACLRYSDISVKVGTWNVPDDRTDTGTWNVPDDRTDTAFEDDWKKEREARYAMVRQARLLSNLPHPPRASRRARLSRRRRSRARTVATPPPPAGKDPS
jgi:hypothetical protein